MKKSKEVFVDGEIVYLKKDILGWHVTHPVGIDINKKIIELKPFKINWDNIHWKNLIAGGNWIKLFLVILFVVIMLFAIFEYAESLRYCSELIAEKISQQVNIDFLNMTLPKT